MFGPSPEMLATRRAGSTPLSRSNPRLKSIGTVKLSEKDESILGLGLDQASLAIPVTSAQT